MKYVDDQMAYRWLTKQARRFRDSGHEQFGDLISVGFITLLEVEEKFNPDYEYGGDSERAEECFRFLGYAKNHVRDKMNLALKPSEAISGRAWKLSQKVRKQHSQNLQDNAKLSEADNVELLAKQFLISTVDVGEYLTMTYAHVPFESLAPLDDLVESDELPDLTLDIQITEDDEAFAEIQVNEVVDVDMSDAAPDTTIRSFEKGFGRSESRHIENMHDVMYFMSMLSPEEAYVIYVFNAVKSNSKQYKIICETIREMTHKDMWRAIVVAERKQEAGLEVNYRNYSPEQVYALAKRQAGVTPEDMLASLKKLSNDQVRYLHRRGMNHMQDAYKREEAALARKFSI